MNTEKFNDALSYIDLDIVDEFINEKEAIKKRKAKRRTIAILTPVAACFIVFVCVSSMLLGYSMAGKNEAPGEIGDHLQIVFESEGTFVFEYNGKRYMAYVAPMLDDEPVSIKNVGECISTVDVIDENGNIAALEIYSSNSETDDGILLKLGSGYFLASGIDKSSRE